MGPKVPNVISVGDLGRKDETSVRILGHFGVFGDQYSDTGFPQYPFSSGIMVSRGAEDPRSQASQAPHLAGDPRRRRPCGSLPGGVY